MGRHTQTHMRETHTHTPVVGGLGTEGLMSRWKVICSLLPMGTPDTQTHKRHTPGDGGLESNTEETRHTHEGEREREPYTHMKREGSSPRQTDE